MCATRSPSTIASLVPVSVRAADEHGQSNNRVSAMFADLPVGIEDPVERLVSVTAQMQHLKRSHEAVAGDVLVGLSGFAPAMLLTLALRTATRVPQRSVNTVTTNVPGPQRPLYAAGRRMLECFPYVPLAGHVRVGVATFSYDGALSFGVTGDYDHAPDIDVLCRGSSARSSSCSRPPMRAKPCRGRTHAPRSDSPTAARTAEISTDKHLDL
jgi:diacylglycerol O-acyltransferase / wax synthase